MARMFPSDALDSKRLTERAKRIWEWCDKNETGILFVDRESGLEKISSVPGMANVFFFRGRKELFWNATLAVIGTRRASLFGLRAAVHFSRQLSQCGWAVASGLALGVDTAATEIVVHSGGRAIAILAHGLDSIYPRTNAALAHRLVREGGLLVSEYPPGMPALKHHFPQRNRIVAALSVGVLIVEAPLKSGALITARLAAEYGREVFTLPGPYDDLGFAGNHRLIQEGAKLVTSIEHILEELPSIPIGLQNPADRRMTPERASLEEIYRRPREERIRAWHQSNSTE